MIRRFGFSGCAMGVLLAAVLALGALALPVWAEEPTASSPDTSASNGASADVSATNSASSDAAAVKSDKNEGRKGELLDLGEDNLINTQQLPDSSFIYDTSIEDLATADTYLEGRIVQVVGEVVGDRIQAELEMDYCWLVLADGDGNTVSAYMTKDASQLVDTFGRYGSTGTTLQVRGAFNLVCADHQGQTDIHADHVSVIAKGRTVIQTFNPWAFLPGFVLVVIGLLMVGVMYLLRERMK